jgi:hypothetical protein
MLAAERNEMAGWMRNFPPGGVAVQAHGPVRPASWEHGVLIRAVCGTMGGYVLC